MALVGLLFGIASEGVEYSWSDGRHWVPDLLVGAAFVGAGAYTLRPRRGAAILLAVTGYLWFLGNIVPGLLYAYRGPLVHLLVTYPGARPRLRPQLVAVVGAYAVAVSPLWSSDVIDPVLAVAVLVFAAARFVGSDGRARRYRLTAVQASALFASAVVVGAAVRQIEDHGDAVAPMVIVFDAAMIWIAILFAVRLRPAEPAVVGDLVVELGDGRGTEPRQALASVLGDPTLQVGYWMGAGVYADATGSPVVVPAADGQRVATFVERDGQPFAVLVHDAAVLDDPALIEAVTAATRLGAANAALLEEVRARLAELNASRRRLVVAADEERRRLATRLRTGVELPRRRVAGGDRRGGG